MPKLRIKSWKECVMDKAVSPIKFGKPIKRKCLCIGKNYYWVDVPTESWDYHEYLGLQIMGRTGIDVRDFDSIIHASTSPGRNPDGSFIEDSYRNNVIKNVA